MKAVFLTYRLHEEIPVTASIKKKKMVKYFNRETAAAMVCAAKLLEGEAVPASTPLYYCKGLVEYEDFGLPEMTAASRNNDSRYDPELFATKGMSSISPLTQFKILYNMPLCFLSIEHGFTGDNAVIYNDVNGLLLQAQGADTDKPIIIGAGRVYKDGTVASGFAYGEKKEFSEIPEAACGKDAVELFKRWAENG